MKKTSNIPFSQARLTCGQAQKWLNMTLKYCWVCGSDDLKWLDPWFAVAHMPIDRIVLDAIKGDKVEATLPSVVIVRCIWPDAS